MRVVLEAQVTFTSTPRGIPIYAIQLIRSLLKRNTYDYALTFFDQYKERNNRRFIDQYFQTDNVDIYECNTVSYKTLMESDAIYREKSYNELTGAYGDIFHFVNVAPIPTNLKGKMVITIHDVLPLTHPEFFPDKLVKNFHYNWNRLLDMRPTMIADSAYTKREIETVSKYQDVHVVPLGYDVETFYCDRGSVLPRELNIRAPYIFYCGALDPRKNLTGVLDAFRDFADELPDVQLVLSGEFSSNADLIRKRIESSKLGDRLILTGYISEDQKRALMSNASVFVFPSFQEGFGLPVLEAMACGCPVITSSLSSLPEVAGDAAILVNPYDISSLADAMKKVVSSTELQNELRRKSLARAKAFSWDKMAEQVEHVYEMILNQ